jgi:hypothetical protein
VTTFHCDKLCSGPCCAPLRFALPFVDSHEIHHCRKWALGEYEACSAVNDPAKLAELMAMALRARGVNTDLDNDSWSVTIVRHLVNGVRISPRSWLLPSGVPHTTTTRRHATLSLPGREYDFDMPEARAKLLAIMATSANETSRDECERILRGNHDKR